ncbi:MAG: GNAT family N-acetyltransferase [Parvibaculaceae bacterium]
MTVEEIAENKAAICRSILESLPDWFGIPESIDRYADEVVRLPMFGVRRDGVVAGFVTIETHNPHVAEIHVIAVRQPFHRQGIGRVLIEACADNCRVAGREILLVKTRAASSDDDASYAATRQFYTAMDFRPLLESATFWDVENPCLLMGKMIRRRP